MGVIEIPTKEKLDFQVTLTPNRDLNLTAACLADDRCPRLTPETVKAFVENDKPFYTFNLESNARTKKICSIWKKLKRREAAPVDDPTTRIFAAFHYHEQLSSIIKSRPCHKFSGDVNGSYWTTNTKVAAASLALATTSFIPIERLHGMVQVSAGSFGYLMRDRAVIDAFASPEVYIADHPNDHLSYIVSAFFMRERLLDIVKGLPGATHIFRKPDTDEIFLIASPNNTIPEIPNVNINIHA